MNKLLFSKKQIVIFTIVFSLFGAAVWQNLAGNQLVFGDTRAEKRQERRSENSQRHHQQPKATDPKQAGTTQQNKVTPAQPATGNAQNLDFKSTLNKIYKNEAVTLSWNSQNATACTGSGTYQGDVLIGSEGVRQKWNGQQAPSGAARTMPLDGPQTFGLTCNGAAGEQSKALNLTVDGVKPNDKPMGVFDQGCPYSHSLPDDPIVFPNQPGKSHLHDFFGFKRTNAFSDFDNMRPTIAPNVTPTTCTEFGKSKGSPPAPNASAYWIPAMYLNGQKVNPANAHVYYKGGSHQKTAAFPPGFKMIAGNAQASLEEAKKANVIKWWCGAHNQPKVGEIPSDCKGSNSIIAGINFPVCWNGQLDSADHKSHMAYAKSGCSSSHSMKLPRIVLNVRYEIFNQTGKRLNPATDKIRLASGGMWTMHADYLFAWDQNRLDFLTHECLNKKIDTSGDKGHQNTCKRNPPQN